MHFSSIILTAVTATLVSAKGCKGPDWPLAPCNCEFGSRFPVQGGGPFWKVHRADLKKGHATFRFNMGRETNEFLNNNDFLYAVKEVKDPIAAEGAGRKGLCGGSGASGTRENAGVFNVIGNNWSNSFATPLPYACGFYNHPTPGYTSFVLDSRMTDANDVALFDTQKNCYCVVARPTNPNYGIEPLPREAQVQYFGNCHPDTVTP